MLKKSSKKLLRTISALMVCFVALLSISVPVVFAEVSSMYLSVNGATNIHSANGESEITRDSWTSDVPSADPNYGAKIKWVFNAPVNGAYTFTLDQGGYVNPGINTTIDGVTYIGDAFIAHLEIDGVDKPMVNNGTESNMCMGTFNLRSGLHTIIYEQDCRANMVIRGMNVTYEATPISIEGIVEFPAREAVEISEDSSYNYDLDGVAESICLAGSATFKGVAPEQKVFNVLVKLENAGDVSLNINGSDYGPFTAQVGGEWANLGKFTLPAGENVIVVSGSDVVLNGLKFQAIEPGYTPEASGVEFTVEAANFIMDSAKYLEKTENKNSPWQLDEYIPVDVSEGDGGMYVEAEHEEYLTYNIYVPEDGIYSVSARAAIGASITAVLNLSIGDQTSTCNVTNTGAYNIFQNFDAGSFMLTEGLHEFKVELTKTGASLRKYVFTKVNSSLELYSAFAGNVAILDNTVLARGTDAIDVYMTNYLADKNATDARVTLTGGGRTIPVELKVDGVKLEVLLKDTLDYSTDYTLTIDNLYTIYNTELTAPVEIYFTTDDDTNDAGTSVAEINKAEEIDGIVTIEGVVTSSRDIGISGRKLKVVTEFEGQALYTDDIDVSGEDGVFAHTIDLTGDDSGLYTIKVLPEYGAYSAPAYIAYVTAEDEIIALGDLKSKTTDNIGDWFNTYEDEFGLSVMNEDGINDISKVYNYFAGSDYSDKETFIKDYESHLVMERLLQGDTDNIITLLENADDCAALGIDGVKAAFLVIKADGLADVTTKRDAFVQELAELTGITTPADYVKAYDAISTAHLFSNLSKATPVLKSDAISAYKTQTAEIPVAFTAEQDDISGAVITVKCTDTAVMEDLELNLKSKLSNVTKTLAADKQSAEFTVELIDVSDKVTELGSLSFDALNTGAYTFKISGYANFEISGKDYNNEAATVDASMALAEQTVSVSVTENTNSGTTEGGAVSSWGGGSSPSKKDDTADEDNKDDENKDDENNEVVGGDTPVSTFTDLADFDWATESIESLTEAGVISKSEDNKYNPQRAVTREEFVKMLVIALGFEETDEAADFADVDGSQWYAPYIAIAKKYGITNGKADGSFGIGEEISRQDMATLAWRALEIAGIKAEASDEAFGDDADIADYAKASVYNMKKLGIINGVGDNKFDANGTSNRAMAAKVIFEMRKAVGE